MCCSGAGGEGLLVAGGWRGLYIDTVRTELLARAPHLSPQVEMLQGSATRWTFVQPLPQMRWAEDTLVKV